LRPGKKKLGKYDIKEKYLGTFILRPGRELKNMA
jgi:hypothetical protein